MLHNTGGTHNKTKVCLKDTSARTMKKKVLSSCIRGFIALLKPEHSVEISRFHKSNIHSLQIADWKGNEGGKLFSSKVFFYFGTVARISYGGMVVLGHREKSRVLAYTQDEGQHNNEYQSLETSRVLACAQAPVLYLPYPIIVEMLRQYDNGAFWFFDKVVSIDAPLINQIIRLPLQGHEIDPKEEAKQVEHDVIIQRIYQGRKGTFGASIPQAKKSIQSWAHISIIESIIRKFKQEYWANQDPMPQRDLLIIYPLISPSAQYHYWTSNAASFTQEPYDLPWSPSDLLIITFPEARKQDELSKGTKETNKRSQGAHPKTLDARTNKEQTEETKKGEEHDQGTSKSHQTSTGVVVTTPPMIQLLTSLPPTFPQSTSQDLLLSYWSQNPPKTEQAQELHEDLVPPPKVEKVREI
eukprot:Gb_09378 [translate_table: standard]